MAFLRRCRVTWQQCETTLPNSFLRRASAKSSHPLVSRPVSLVGARVVPNNHSSCFLRRRNATALPWGRGDNWQFSQPPYFISHCTNRGVAKGLESCLGWPVSPHRGGCEGNGILSSGKCFLINAIEYAV